MDLVRSFIQAKKDKKRLSVLTAYDTPTAEILDEAGVDMILVGDSLGMVVLGYSSTQGVTMDEMLHHAKAVRRGVKKALVIADLPLKGIEKGPRQALSSAKRFLEEARCDAVKVEWGKEALRITDLLIKNKIPVMGHVGLTPQTVSKESAFRVQGVKAREALQITRQALEFEKHGAFSVILECIPSPVAAQVTRRLKIPTIGIGAGPNCNGQVLVFHDLVGFFNRFTPRFVKRYARLDLLAKKAVESYISDVQKGRFPQKKHAFLMPLEEQAKFEGGVKRLNV